MQTGTTDHKKFKNLKETGLVPQYALIPLLSILFLNVVVYFLTGRMTGGMKHYDISVPLDAKIPFLPVFIIPYLSAYAQWIVCYITVARSGRDYCYKVIGAEMVSRLIICVCYVLLPTIMVRGTITGIDPFSQLTALLYRIDAPTNLFPSNHCLESYICLRTALEMKRGRGYKIAMTIMSILVILSTLFVRQHLILDLFGSVLVAEIGFLVVGICRKSAA